MAVMEEVKTMKTESYRGKEKSKRMRLSALQRFVCSSNDICFLLPHKTSFNLIGQLRSKLKPRERVREDICNRLST